jgi:hypothetical protein
MEVLPLDLEFLCLDDVVHSLSGRV